MTLRRKAGFLDFLGWVGVALFIIVFALHSNPKMGILQYAHLSDKGLYVKDLDGQERKAYMVGDDIYVDGQLVGRRIIEPTQ
jgi:hypothetical protein